MALIAVVDDLVCSDSAAMHIATALGIPVTAVFGPQKHEWLGPRHPMHRVVSISEMPCRPCFDSCIYSSPLCMDRITPGMVSEALDAQLTALGGQFRPGSVRATAAARV